MLVGLHVLTNFQMYRQNSEKALLGGGGNCPLPPPPPLATLMFRVSFVATDLMGFHKTPYGRFVPTQFFAHRSQKSSEIWNDCISRNGHRIKITQPKLMILVSFSSAEYAWSYDMKKHYTFSSQGTENPPFRFFLDTRYRHNRGFYRPASRRNLQVMMWSPIFIANYINKKKNKMFLWFFFYPPSGAPRLFKYKFDRLMTLYLHSEEGSC